MRNATRIRPLDGLRGICASIVALFHWWLLYPPAWAAASGNAQPADGLAVFLLKYTPLNILVAGSSAVMVFFVISGVVLTLTFMEVDQQQYTPYALKRFCRIYIPYAATMVVSLIAMGLVRPTPIESLSLFFNTMAWSHTISAIGFLNYVLMTNQDITLDPVIWSLAHEMRISLLFPLMLMLVLRWRLRALVGLTALSLAAELVAKYLEGSWTVYQLDKTLCYLFLFAFGSMFYLNIQHRTHRTTMSGMRVALLWIAVLAPIVVATGLNALNTSRLAFTLSCVGAILVVGLTLSSNPVSDRILASRWAVWLGRISDSLYLVHMPVQLTLVHLLYDKLPITILLGIGGLSTVLLAWLMSATLERGSQQLGRRLASLATRYTARSDSDVFVVRS